MTKNKCFVLIQYMIDYNKRKRYLQKVNNNIIEKKKNIAYKSDLVPHHCTDCSRCDLSKLIRQYKK